MFKIIENYSQFFNFCVKNQFAGEISAYDDVPVIKPEKTEKSIDLINKIKSDGNIDGNDLTDLNKLEEALNVEIDEVKNETQKELLKSYKETLSKGFGVKNESDYKVLKMLLSKIDPSITLPDYNSLSINKINFSVVYENNVLKIFDNSFGSKMVGLIDKGSINYSSLNGSNALWNDNSFDVDLDQILLKSKPSANTITENEQKVIDKEQENLNLDSQKSTDEDNVNLSNDKNQNNVKQDESKEVESDIQKLNEAYAFYRHMSASPENILAIQNALLNNKEKLGNFGSDSKFGKVTFDAIISFQTKNDLKVDGKVGTETLKKLGLINEKQSSKDFYINTIKTNKTNNTSENISKSSNTEEKSDLEEITLPEDKYSNIKEVDLSKDDSVTDMELDNYTSDKYETNISGESVYIESDGENTVKLVIDDFQSPTTITGVPVGQEQAVVEKYKDSLLSSIDFSDSHTYEDIMGE